MSDVFYTAGEDISATETTATASDTDSAPMLQQMDQSSFGEFVADLWSRQGWETQVQVRSERLYVAAQRERPQSERGLIWAAAATGERVSGQGVQQFATFCEDSGVDEAAVVTAGEFTDDAERIAESHGISLLDGDRFEAFVDQHGLAEFARQYVDAPDDAEEGSAGTLTRLKERGQRAVDRADVEVSSRSAVAVLLAVSLLAAGVTLGPSLLPSGSGTQSPDGATMNVTADALRPANSTGRLNVRWNVRTQSRIEAADGGLYDPPEGEQFLVVELRLTNVGGRNVSLRQTAFQLRANGSKRGYQPLAGTSGFPETTLAPGETATGWTVFSVAERTDAATVVVAGSAYDRENVTVRFTRYPEMEVAVSE